MFSIGCVCIGAVAYISRNSCSFVSSEGLLSLSLVFKTIFFCCLLQSVLVASSK